MLTALLLLLAWPIGSVVLGLAIGRAVAIAHRRTPPRNGGRRRTAYAPAA